MAQPLAHNLEEKPRTKDIIVDENYNFKSLLLSNCNLQGLTDAGFFTPSPIQLKAIPLGKCGLDLIVQSKSGTGKTAVFAIIALEMLQCEKTDVQVLILAPTREIAVQIESVINTIGKHVVGLKVRCFIGGLPIEQDIANLKNCNIAIGAPGRITHLIEGGHLNTNNIRLLVLDEADKLMEDSFQKNINYIYNKLPARKQVVTCSATYTNDLKDFLENYMQCPTFVTPQVEIPILLGLRQFVSVIKSNANKMQKMNAKIDELTRLFSKVAFTQCLVFCNYQTQAESVSNFLNGKGWETNFISGAQSQKERLKAFDSLKKFECRILLSTDLTARGIDAANIDLVINYDVPYEADTYLHRMGRAGRYGSPGICVTIVSDDKEMNDLQKILGSIGGTELSIAKLPEGEQLTDDVWKVDLNTLPKLCGVVSSDEAIKRHNLSDSVLEIKHLKKKSKTDVVSSELEKLSVVEQVSNQSKSSKKKSKREAKRHEDAEKNSDQSNTDATAQEDQQSQNLTNTSGDGLVSPASLYPWVPVDMDVSNDNDAERVDYDADRGDYKKKKYNDTGKEEAAISRSNPSTADLVAKNVRLYNISKLLSGDSSEFDTAAQSASYLLQNIKQTEESRIDEIYNQLESQSCEDILKNLESLSTKQESCNEPKPGVEPTDPLENIFQLGYSFICKGGMHWIDALGENYKPVEKEEVSEMEQEDEEEEQFSEHYDECGAEYEENYNLLYHNQNMNQRLDYRRPTTRSSLESHRSNRYGIKRRNQHYTVAKQRFDYGEQAAGTSLENYYCDRYGKYFDHCIDSSMSKAENIEDSTDFENWFGEWQYHMKATRDFVQQNIYMDIMNYQYPRN